MKTLKKSIFYLFALATLIGCNDKPIVEADYAVVPLPQSIVMGGEAFFALNENTKIGYSRKSEIQKQTAQFLAEYIKLTTGMDLKLTDEEVIENAIILHSDYVADKAESYNISVNQKRILINGIDDAGIFYGVQTLRKSIPAEASQSKVTFPAVEINDYPRFGYRGMMLDVSRHFFPVEFVKKYIDILALHNINRFHWHLTDDQGWRIEMKNYPELTQIGSQRAQTVIGRNSGKFDGQPYGGYYTQEEIKDVVAYAQKRFITIIPEVDLPGHMLAALAAYPNLGCTGGPYKVAEQWGVFDDVLCAGNEEVYVFLENVFGELINLFPSEYIHIGGDECPKVRWKECPKCKAKIRELGLRADSKHTKEERLQSYMISRVDQFLSSKGRQIIGWNEILEGGLIPNATVMSWQGTQGGIEAAISHHEAIMTPTDFLYFDYYQTKSADGEPLAIGGYVPVEKAYSFDPVPASLTDTEKKFIIGVQANLWTEYIIDGSHVEYMVLPRMGALSEIQWTMPEKKSYEKFLPRLARLMELYKKLGYNYATHIRDIADNVVTDTARGIISVTLFTYDGTSIYYTLDGTEPSEKSTPYTTPIEIKSSAELKAIAIRGTEKSRIYTNSFGFNKATLKDITLESEPYEAYSFSGAITLVDGKRGEDSFSNGQWLGMNNKDFVATIDLKKSMDVSVGTYLATTSWIFGATGFTVLLSEDGKKFVEVFNKKYPVMTPDSPDGQVLDLVATFPTQKARYVKVIAKITKTIPAWHEGRGRPSFIFVDEVMVE